MITNPHMPSEVPGDTAPTTFNSANAAPIVPTQGYHASVQPAHNRIGPVSDGTPLAMIRQVPSTATISFSFGVLGICFTPLFVSAIVAIVAGHLAHRDIHRAAGQLGGKGQARAGLIMGYVGLGLNITFALGYIIYTIISA